MNVVINQNIVSETENKNSAGFLQLAERITDLSNFSSEDHAVSTEISRAVQVQMNFIINKEKKNRKLKKAFRSFIKVIKGESRA